MGNERQKMTPYQRRLVNIGIVIQFYLAAIGHVVVWGMMYRSLQRTVDPNNEGLFITEIFVYTGIPISFGILIAVYIFYRILLAYASLETALSWMIGLNLIHSVIMFPFYVTPLRLAIPTILYCLAYRGCRKERVEEPE